MLDFIYNFMVSMTTGDKNSTMEASSLPQEPMPALPLDILLCIIDNIPATDVATLASLRLTNSPLCVAATRKLFSIVVLTKDLKTIQAKIKFILRSDMLQYVRRVQIYESAFYVVSKPTKEILGAAFTHLNPFTSIIHRESPGSGIKSSKEYDGTEDCFASMFLSDQEYSKREWMTPAVELTGDIFWLLEALQNRGIEVEVFFDGNNYSWRKREGFKGLVDYHLGVNGREVPPISQMAMSQWWGMRERQLRLRGL